jgi:hypothetical protein
MVTITGTEGTHQNQNVVVGFLLESAQDNITAFAGGGQGNATPLAAEVNRITAVASIGDSVRLPPSAPGLSIVVINHGGRQMQVYGSGADTVNDVASATGIPQMAGSTTIYACATAGAWYSNGTAEGYANGLLTMSYSDGIVARAGGGQAGAVPLTAMINRVTTVATAADSVSLPTAVPGLTVTVINAAAANAMQVFAALGSSDTIDGVAGATGYAQAAGKTVEYLSTAAGAWHKIVSA